MTETAIVDAEVIERLRSWGGSDLVGKMIRLFLDNTPEKIERIRAGITEGALDEAERGAHSLKSSAGNLGAALLTALAHDVERSAAHGDVESLASLLPRILETYDRTRTELEAVTRELAE